MWQEVPSVQYIGTGKPQRHHTKINNFMKKKKKKLDEFSAFTGSFCSPASSQLCVSG